MAQKLGIIAGNGRFPFLVLDAARSLGYESTVFAIKEEAFKDIEEAAASAGAAVHWISIGELGKFLQLLKANHITRALMAGQVKHVQIFGGFLPDMTALSLLTRLKGMNTDALIGAVADLLRDNGVELINSAALLEPMLAGAGRLSDRVPNEQEHKDLEFGYRCADAIAGLDIGQTIAVKHQAVVAVEAMEGTDETIARAGHLAGDGVTIIKVAKPNQDMRFDVPIVGLATIQAMRVAGAKCLSVDAGKTLIFDREAFFASANEAGIAVIGRDVSSRTRGDGQ
jgi:DUF1009 family protein